MREGGPASQADAKLKELCRSIQLLVALLESAGETHWTNWLRTDLRRLKSGDTHAVQHLLQAFGGMGSFNDLFIHPLNDHPAGENDVRQINERLSALRSDTYELADKLNGILNDQ